MIAVLNYPDLSDRPYALSLDFDLKLDRLSACAAWTKRIGAWFADPQSVNFSAEVGAVFFFETVHKFENREPSKRYPHYGRILNLQPGRLIEMTWVTGVGGTEGAETVLLIEIQELSPGKTRLKLTHKGFKDEASCERHRYAWPFVIEKMESILAGMQ